MSTPEPDLDEVMTPDMSAPRDRQEHGGVPPRPNDEALQHRTEQERQAVASDDATPGGAEEHPATDRPPRTAWRSAARPAAGTIGACSTSACSGAASPGC